MYGLIDKYNGQSHLPHWLSDSCNQLNGTDGSIFPPHITPERVLHIYDKDLCRLMPLVYEKEVLTKADVVGYRFTPPTNVFSDVDSYPENSCYCPQDLLLVRQMDYLTFHSVNMVNCLIIPIISLLGF